MSSVPSFPVYPSDVSFQLWSKLITHLSSHPLVTGLQVYPSSPGVSTSDISQWESAISASLPSVSSSSSSSGSGGARLRLPLDLATFYQSVNGLDVTWSLKEYKETTNPNPITQTGGKQSSNKQNNIIIQEKPKPLGCIHINSLQQLKRVYLGKFRFTGKNFRSWDEDDESSDEEASSLRAATKPTTNTFPIAFDLDAYSAAGAVLLIYTSPTESSIWFCSLSLKLYYICDTFTDYFTLVLLHYGLPYWQYSFTDTPLPNQTREYLALFCPERLLVDLSHHRRLPIHLQLTRAEKMREKERAMKKQQENARLLWEQQQQQSLSTGQTSASGHSAKKTQNQADKRKTLQLQLSKMDKYIESLLRG